MTEPTATETHHVRLGDGASKPPVLAIVGLFSETPHRPFTRIITEPIEVGRGSECDVTLDDSKVSRVHARLSPRGDQLIVADLDSHNGTYLNGARIDASAARAGHGAVLRIGRSLALVVANGREFLGFDSRGDGELVGGPTLDAVWRLLETIAPDTGPVLLVGESGTGKEHCGKLLHQMSKRAGALVTVNCAALPEPLAESELFGHVAGAFSGSKKQRGGLFVEAHRGTLFLDEIGDLPLDLQPKLLRILEEGSLRPVGADRPREVDVRVVAATNRNLDAMVEAGHFRLDLLHRLGAQRVALPPLRERREDIPALVVRACEAQSIGVDLLVMERWLLAAWPGNVRQLNNEVARLAVRARHEGLSTISLGLLERDSAASAATPTAAGDGERERLIRALQQCRGNVAETARELGLQRTKLYDLLNRHNIDPREFRRGPRG